MNTFWLVWLGTAAAMLAAMYAAKCAREGRVAGPGELYWPTLLTLCIIVGGVAAFVFEATSSRQVEVPPGLQEQIPLPPRG